MSTPIWLALLVVVYLAGLVHGELRARNKAHRRIGAALAALEGQGMVKLEPRSAPRIQRESGHRIH